MLGTEFKSIDCPYCGETIEIMVDTSISQQEYIEDCQVCCRPITLRITTQEASICVQALDENEY